MPAIADPIEMSEEEGEVELARARLVPPWIVGNLNVPDAREMGFPGSCGPALCCTGNPDRHLARPDDRIWGAVTKATSDELVTGAHSLLTPQ
jgi:hypothetical protein